MPLSCWATSKRTLFTFSHASSKFDFLVYRSIDHNQVHTSTGITPAQIFIGSEQQLEFENTIPLDQRLFQYNQALLDIWRNEAKIKLSKQVKQVKKIAKAWIICFTSSKKKNIPWLGPFKIVQKTGSVIYTLIGNKNKPFDAHYNQLKLTSKQELAAEPFRGRSSPSGMRV